MYLRGRGIAVIGVNQVPFSRGTVICHPPDIPHSERARSDCLGFFITADHCPFGDRDVPVSTDDSWHSFFRLISLLHGEWSKKAAGWEEATHHLLELLFLHLQRQCFPSAPGHPLVTALCRRIESHLSDPDFQVGEALASLPMSPDHLRRRFQQETGRSPLAYLNERRVTRARQLLREGRWLVKEVAAQVGIDDPYYFSRLFLKHTGQYPQAFRRSAQKSDHFH